jgi:hypothetical protein
MVNGLIAGGAGMATTGDVWLYFWIIDVHRDHLRYIILLQRELCLQFNLMSLGRKVTRGSRRWGGARLCLVGIFPGTAVAHPRYRCGLWMFCSTEGVVLSPGLTLKPVLKTWQSPRMVGP